MSDPDSVYWADAFSGPFSPPADGVYSPIPDMLHESEYAFFRDVGAVDAPAIF